MKIIGIIPARYASTRMPGKPIMDICGYPMIWWVYNQAKQVKAFDEVVVATESEKIVEVCNKYGMNVILTSDNCATGTDRVVEASETVKGDLYVVVMGDEPMIGVSDIEAMVEAMTGSISYDAGMLCTKFKNGVDLINPSTIKLALNDNHELIFMSRYPIPFPKSELDYDHHKNVGVYAFTKDALEFFKNTPRGRLERAEDMEMMRMLENHKLVKVVEVDTESMSVDTYKDLLRIRAMMEKKLNQDK